MIEMDLEELTREKKDAPLPWPGVRTWHSRPGGREYTCGTKWWHRRLSLSARYSGRLSLSGGFGAPTSSVVMMCLFTASINWSDNRGFETSSWKKSGETGFHSQEAVRELS